MGKNLLERLAQRYFLRPEPNPAGGYTYELAHDTLVQPILSFKTQRKAAERAERDKKLQAELQAERQRANELDALRAEAENRSRIAQSRTRIAVGVAVVAVLASVLAAGAMVYAYLLKDDA